MFHCAYVSPLQGRGGVGWGGGACFFASMLYLRYGTFHCAYFPSQRVICFTAPMFHHRGWYVSLITYSITEGGMLHYFQNLPRWYFSLYIHHKGRCFTASMSHLKGWNVSLCFRSTTLGGMLYRANDSSRGVGGGGICFTVSKFHNTGQCVSLCLHSTAVN